MENAPIKQRPARGEGIQAEGILVEVEQVGRGRSDRASEPCSLDDKSPRVAARDCTCSSNARDGGTLKANGGRRQQRRIRPGERRGRCVRERETEQTLRSQRGDDEEGGRGRGR